MTTETTETAVDYGYKLLDFLSTQAAALSPILILTHDYPDPDALAASFALQLLLQQGFKVESRIVYRGEVGRTENKAMVRLLRIPIHKLRPGDLKKYRQVALVDTQPDFQNNPFPKNRRATLILDQHASKSAPDAELALIDPKCGATCVIVAKALLLQGIAIPSRVATALAYGILTDTMGLYRAQRPDVVQTYLEILHSCDMHMLARIQNPVRSRRFFATLGKGIRDATIHRRLLVTHLGQVETPDLVSQVAEYLLAYRRADWSFATGRYKGRLHASLRTTQTEPPAGEVLRDAFGNPKEAGGHGTIAGGSTRVGNEAAEEAYKAREQAIQQRLMKRLRIRAKAEARKPFER